MARVRVEYNADPAIPEDIQSYFHCRQCITEIQNGTAGIQSPRDYARTQIGIRPNGGFQVVCNRHNCNVAVITFSTE